MHVERPATNVGTLADDDALSPLLRHNNICRHRVRLVLDTQHTVFKQPPHPRKQQLRCPLHQDWTACRVRIQLFKHSVIKRQHLVAGRLDEEQLLKFVKLLRHFHSQVLRLRPVGVCVQLPNIILKRREFLGWRGPRRAMLRDGSPTIVVNPAITDDLKILGRMTLLGPWVIKRIPHADAFDRVLLNPVDEPGFRQISSIEHGRRDVNDVTKLRPDLTLGRNALGPMHHGSVTGTAPMRCHLLCPLIGRVHGTGPAHRIVIVRVRAS